MKRSGKTVRILRGNSRKRGDKKGKKPLLNPSRGGIRKYSLYFAYLQADGRKGQNIEEITGEKAVRI